MANVGPNLPFQAQAVAVPGFYGSEGVKAAIGVSEFEKEVFAGEKLLEVFEHDLWFRGGAIMGGCDSWPVAIDQPSWAAIAEASDKSQGASFAKLRMIFTPRQRSDEILLREWG